MNSNVGMGRELINIGEKTNKTMRANRRKVNFPNPVPEKRVLERLNSMKSSYGLDGQ